MPQRVGLSFLDVYYQGTNMELTTEQLNILNHVVVDGQAWADNALHPDHVIAKVNRHRQSYLQSVSKGGHKDRVVVEEDDRVANLPTPMQEWKRLLAKADRMGMPRYLEDLITSNSLTMNIIMKERYDAKIKLRGERP